MTHLDPRTNQCELEVQRIIHLQNLANQLPNAFIDTKKVTKSHILVLLLYLCILSIVHV